MFSYPAIEIDEHTSWIDLWIHFLHKWLISRWAGLGFTWLHWLQKLQNSKKANKKKRRINYHDMQVNIIYFEFNWIFAQKKIWMERGMYASRSYWRCVFLRSDYHFWKESSMSCRLFNYNHLFLKWMLP